MGGRAIVLIGPGRHFGVELVRRFASEGYAVAVVGSRPDRLHALELELSDLGSAVHYMAADVTEEELFRVRLETLAASLGDIEGMIYNPKFSVAGSALEVTPSDFNQAMAVNATGALVAIQAIIPFLRSRRRCVILTGGGYKDRPHSQKFALSMGKAILHSLFETLKPILRKRGIQLKTVIIDGAIRRDGPPEMSAEAIAEFYWEIFSGGKQATYRFPAAGIRSDTQQLKLAV
ncbi:MAG: SDR family NAD(P)-dependent oxidoreductase [Hyphomonadaceae bacterium]